MQNDMYNFPAAAMFYIVQKSVLVNLHIFPKI
jgi:hypothetical protein